jgi:phosphoribosylglycinamide formyltransferase-1
MINLAILASHNGSGLDAIYEAVSKNILNININLIISNNTNANVLQKATKYDIDKYVINAKTHQEPDDAIYSLLQEYSCSHIFLSGYMKKLSPNITNNFKVINSHPSLLPKYGGHGMYGRFVHEAVVKNKESVSGVTIHEVNEEYDKGHIILQKQIQLSPDECVDTLEKKIKELEKIAIIDGLKKCLN